MIVSHLLLLLCNVLCNVVISIFIKEFQIQHPEGEISKEEYIGSMKVNYSPEWSTLIGPLIWLVAPYYAGANNTSKILPGRDILYLSVCCYRRISGSYSESYAIKT